MTRRVLVGFSTREGQTERVAHRLAQRMRAAGDEVEVWDVADVPAGRLEDADAVVLGAALPGGPSPSRMVRFVQRHLGVLARKPTAFFSLGPTRSPPSAEHWRAAQGLAQELQRETGWSPGMLAVFAGALGSTPYGLMLRRVPSRRGREAGGPVDRLRHGAFTQWESVEHFAEDFLRGLAASGLSAARVAPSSEPAPQAP